MAEDRTVQPGGKRDPNLWRLVNQLVEQVNTLREIETPICRTISPLLAQGYPCAPTTALIAGTLNGSYDYAVSNYSSETLKETPLGDSVTATPAGNGVRVTGERTLDVEFDYVRLYRKKTADDSTRWLLLAEIANPNSGSWSYDDTTTDVNALGARRSTLFSWNLWTPSTADWSIVRCMLRTSKDIASSTGAYWQFWLSRKRNGGTLDEPISLVAETQNYGLQASRPFYLRRITPTGSGASDELRYRLDRWDGVYLNARGIGLVSALPPLTVQLDVSRQGD